MAEQQAEGSAAAEVQQCAQHEAGAETAAYATHEEPKDNPYLHRHGTREYMQAEVMSYVQQALEALAGRIQQERLKLAAGVDREEGKYLPHGWRPFCPHRWMAEYLIAHKPQAADTAAAAAAASQGS